MQESSSAGLQGEVISFNVEEVQQYGVNKFWPVIPMEFLKADGQAPAVEITVDDIPALCVNIDCEYTYIRDLSNTITGQ